MMLIDHNNNNIEISMSNNENILLKDRRAFTARQSMDALIGYARLVMFYLDSRTKKYIPGTEDSIMPDCSVYLVSSSFL